LVTPEKLTTKLEEIRSHLRPERPSAWHSEAFPNGRQAIERDAAVLLYRHGIGSVLVSVLASSGLAFISFGQVSHKLLILWWVLMSSVLAIRGLDILHFHRFRISSFRSGVQERLRFGVGVVASAALWAAFPMAMLRDLSQTGRAYTAIVLCGMVGGGATVLAPSRTLSLIFCAFLVLPTSTIFLFLHGRENTFLGILGWAFFAVMSISSRVTNRATMTALRLSRDNEALMNQMDNERRQTEATNTELKAAEVALSEANRSLERRVELRTADLEN
jgi:hypothetical protein